jgi:hypothetical protein
MGAMKPGSKGDGIAKINAMRAGFLVAFLSGAGFSGGAWAGTFDLSYVWDGLNLDYKVVLGYGVAMRMEDPAQALINGPVDQMQIVFDPLSGGIGKFTHTGLPITANFDDANRNFDKNSLLNNRGSAYGEMRLAAGDFGGVASGAYFYDLVFDGENDNTSESTVNNDLEDARREGPDSNRTIPVNAFTHEARQTSGEKNRLLEAYVYGDVSLGESVHLNARFGRHLAAWGESLFFPGVVAAQGPFDATKAFVPGAEVKEIILPTKQASFNMAVGSDITVLGMYQLEFKETEIFPMGDFFSPADLVGPGGIFGYGSINPVHPDHCDEPTVTDGNTGMEAPPGTLCTAGEAFENEPEYVVVTRTADNIPADTHPWGAGLKYQVTQDLNIGAYYLRYNNHNPNVQLNMGFARVGDDAATGTEVTTEEFGVKVPTSYTVAYADNVEMTALSFSTVFWVFNLAGEVIHRENIDTSLESTIAGVVAPWGTRGKTTQVQMSWLYVENPDFLYYDEVIVVGEAGWLHVDEVEPVANQEGVCMSGTSDCSDFSQKGDVLFYDKESSAVQVLVLSKGRNVFNGWDLGTPVSFAWLIDGTPSTPGVFGSLYGEGDMRFSVGVTLQYLQNLEFATSYNGFLGDANKHIRNSTLKANPYVDHDYLTFTVKYNL